MKLLNELGFNNGSVLSISTNTKFTVISLNSLQVGSPSICLLLIVANIHTYTYFSFHNVSKINSQMTAIKLLIIEYIYAVQTNTVTITT